MRTFVKLVSTPKILFAGAFVGAGIVEVSLSTPSMIDLLLGAAVGIVVIATSLRLWRK